MALVASLIASSSVFTWPQNAGVDASNNRSAKAVKWFHDLAKKLLRK
jgi:hypothetical protein